MNLDLVPNRKVILMQAAILTLTQQPLLRIWVMKLKSSIQTYPQISYYWEYSQHLMSNLTVLLQKAQ